MLDFRGAVVLTTDSLNLTRTSGTMLLIMVILKDTTLMDMYLLLKTQTCTMVATLVMVVTRCLSRLRCHCNNSDLPYAKQERSVARELSLYLEAELLELDDSSQRWQNVV